MAKQAAARLQAASDTLPADDRNDITPEVPTPPCRSRYAFPWPDEIEGLGLRHVDAFAPCSNCEAGTWMRYGSWPLCLRCSNLGRPGQ
jgi:hypothetical protein